MKLYKLIDPIKAKELYKKNKIIEYQNKFGFWKKLELIKSSKFDYTKNYRVSIDQIEIN